MLTSGSRGGGCPAGAKFWGDLGVGHTCLVALLAPCLQSIFSVLAAVWAGWPVAFCAGTFVHIIVFWLSRGATAGGASVLIPSFLRVTEPPLVSSLKVVA